MRKVSCITHDLVLRHHSVDGGFKLSVDNLHFYSESNKPLAIPFIGRSGSGKSTLLEALATMLKPYSGQIKWIFEDNIHKREFIWTWKNGLEIGERVSEKVLAELRARYFGFAFQDATLMPFLTVKENLIYPQRLIGKSIHDAELHARNRLESTFVNDDIDSILRKYPQQLSGGQRQRVSLIQAMCNDPFVLLADEPTGSLDEKTRKEVMAVVTDIWQEEEGGMFLWVTHHKEDQDKAEQYLFINGSNNNSEAVFHTLG